MAGQPRSLSRLPLPIRVVAILATTLGGVLGVVSFVSTMFEANGGLLAREPRHTLMVLYALATVACVAVPTVLWRLLFPRHRWWGLVLVIVIIALLSVPTMPLWLPHGGS
jgi:hypothetical protein